MSLVDHVLQIGVTGGIGSGKSLVTKAFNLFGAPVYDADIRAKYLMNHDPSLVSAIKERFGVNVYNSRGLDRQYMARTVFNDAEELKALNELVHPRVGEDYEEWLNEHSGEPYVVKEAALLFEAGTYKSLDQIVLVFAPEDLRIARVLERDDWRTEEDVRNIISRQMPEEEKKEMADEIIRNDESCLILQQVQAMDQKWRKG